MKRRPRRKTYKRNQPTRRSARIQTLMNSRPKLDVIFQNFSSVKKAPSNNSHSIDDYQKSPDLFESNTVLNNISVCSSENLKKKKKNATTSATINDVPKRIKKNLPHHAPRIGLVPLTTTCTNKAKRKTGKKEFGNLARVFECDGMKTRAMKNKGDYEINKAPSNFVKKTVEELCSLLSGCQLTPENCENDDICFTHRSEPNSTNFNNQNALTNTFIKNELIDKVLYDFSMQFYEEASPNNIFDFTTDNDSSPDLESSVDFGQILEVTRILRTLTMIRSTVPSYTPYTDDWYKGFDSWSA